MAHNLADPKKLLAQKDAAAIKADVFPTDGPDDPDGPLGSIIQWLRDTFPLVEGEPLDVQSGPGILGLLDPSGGGAALAAFPLVSRGARKATSSVTNIAEETGFLRKLFEGVDAEDIARIYEKEQMIKPEAAEKAAQITETLLKHADDPEIKDLIRTTANLKRSAKGRTFLSIHDLMSGPERGVFDAAEFANKVARDYLSGGGF